MLSWLALIYLWRHEGTNECAPDGDKKQSTASTIRGRDDIHRVHTNTQLVYVRSYFFSYSDCFIWLYTRPRALKQSTQNI